MRAFERQEKWIRIGWQRTEKGRYKAALRAFRWANRPANAEAQLAIGYVWELLEETERAEAAYADAIESGSPEAVTALAALCVRTERRSQALLLLEKGAARNIPSALLLRAGLLSEDSRPAEARVDYLRAAELGLTEGWNGLALHEFNQGHIEEALACCREAHRLGDPHAAYNMSLVLLNQDQVDEARSWLLKSVERGYSEAMYLLGNLDESDGMLREAEKWYKQAVLHGNFEARYAMGDTYADNLDRRIRPVLEQYAGDKKTAEHLGILYINRKRYDKAVPIWKAIADSGDPNGHYNLGVIFQRQGHIEKALEHYRLAAAGGSLWAKYSLGSHYQQVVNNLQLARYWYEQAAEAGHHYAAYNLGNIYFSEKRLDSAKEMYEKAAARGLDRAQNNLANILLDEAEEHYNDRLERQENTAEPRTLFGPNGLARSLEDVPEPEKGLIKKAQKWYDSAAAQELAECYLNLAGLLHDLGEFESAEHWYKQAVEKEDPEALYGYACLLKELDRESETLRLYQASARLGFDKSIEYIRQYTQKKT